MNTMLAAFFGGWEIVLILAVILLMFGSKKLPELAKGLGQGIKEFKKATREVTDEMHNAMNETPAPPQKTIAAPAPPASTVPNQTQSAAPQPPPGQKV
jgi:sec-independent protein translocase protein TatA